MDRLRELGVEVSHADVFDPKAASCDRGGNAIAATIASLAAEPGVYNVVDDDPLPVAEWLPAFARWVNAPELPHVSVEDALKKAGEEAVYYHTKLTGASNSRAKALLGFTPRPLLWKGGAS